MGQRYKEYDKKYKSLIGTALANIVRLGGRIAREDIDSIEGWDEDGLKLYYQPYQHEFVTWAVYDCLTADEWQRFRVSLKGLSTREKLYCLMHRWVMLDMQDRKGIDAKIERCRICNYLGALKRSGHLDAELRVVR